ncbi:MAG: AhpC/TSA family protein [Bacteroidetes bacterium]|nr:MAG: AhpC/TSA family protein [Bacteroidota bacterium]
MQITSLPVVFFSGLLLLLFQSCKSDEQSQEYSLSGNIVGIDDGQVILKKLELTTNKTLDLDTAIIENGMFALQGTVEQPYPHSLVINDSLQVNFFLENSNIDIQINTLEGRMDVAGSVSDSLFQPYWSRLEELWSYADSLQLQGLLATTEEERRIIDSLIEEQSSVEMLFSLEFINQYPASYVSPFAAFYFVQTYEVSAEGLRELLDSFDPKLENSDYVQALEEIYALKAKLSPGQPAPEIILPDDKGVVHKLEDFRGKLVLLDFWASWCRPCREQNQYLKNLYEEQSGKDFVIISISLDENREDWLRALQKDEMNWPQLSSLKGWNTRAAIDYGVKAIPQNFLIDFEGNILGQNVIIPELKVMLDQLQ